MRLAHAILLLLSAICVALPSFAQENSSKSTLSFERMGWDFGVIKEVDGPVSYTFKFINKGSVPIVLERVAVSCGCTTPEYSQKPILPGAQGEMKITFDPEERPGMFIKDIYVSSGAGKNRDKITVRGEVVGRPRSVEEDYPYQLNDGLRLQRFDANFSYVDQLRPSSTVVAYANTSDKPVRFDFAVSPADGSMTVSSLPTICGGCRGDITITYDMRGRSVYGRVGHRVDLWVNGKKETLGITTTAIAVDRFSLADTVTGARAKLLPPMIDMGDVANGVAAAVEFTIVNEGSRILIIRAVQSRKDVVTDLKPGTQIAPGKELKVKATVKPSGNNGGFFADGIYITTNDPTAPMKELRIMGKIK